MRLVTLVVILITRLLGVVSFYWLPPLVAYLINGILDAGDGPLYKHFIHLNPSTAQSIDKALDLWLYGFAYCTILQLPTNQLWFFPIVTMAFWYRVIGQVLFFTTQNRKVLLFFPNFFEVIFIYGFLSSNFHWSTQIHTVVLLGLGFGKIMHEYLLHHQELTIFDHLLLPLWHQRRISATKKILSKKTLHRSSC